MTLAQALINTELATNESRAAKFARQSGALLSTDDSPAIATIVTCPNEECVNGYIPKQHNCWEHGYSDEGCPDCNWLGYTAPKCEQCKGEGQVLMYKDGTVEALI